MVPLWISLISLVPIWFGKVHYGEISKQINIIVHWFHDLPINKFSLNKRDIPPSSVTKVTTTFPSYSATQAEMSRKSLFLSIPFDIEV